MFETWDKFQKYANSYKMDWFREVILRGELGHMLSLMKEPRKSVFASIIVRQLTSSFSSMDTRYHVCVMW